MTVKNVSNFAASAVAEKFQAIVYLGTLNSRMKDFYDVWLLASQFAFDGAVLAKAVAATFKIARPRSTSCRSRSRRTSPSRRRRSRSGPRSERSCRTPSARKSCQRS